MDKYMTLYQSREISNQCKKLYELVSEPYFFIDIGVGKLDSEAWIMKKYWPICSMIGFEPSKQRYEYLKETYPGLLVNEAVSNSFYVNGYDGVDFVLNCREEEKKLYSPVTIGSITVDQLLSRCQVPKVVVWADVEGSELEVLKGASLSLGLGRIKALNLELNKERVADGWCTADEVVEFLARYNYVPVDMPKEFDHIDVIFIKEK